MGATEKLFVVGVANLTAFDQDDNLVLTGKALLDSSLKTSVSSAEVRGGYGNSLFYRFYHTSALELTITNAEWSLPYIAKTVGATLVTGSNVYTSQNVTLVANAGAVTNTPLAAGTDNVYGWATLADGSIERFTFDTGLKTFTLTNAGGTATDTVCVQYYYLNPAAKNITIPANIIPSVLRVVLSAQLASNTDSANIVGSVEIVVPSLILSGAVDFNMKADGTSVTNLSGSALAFTPPANSGCVAGSVYAYVNEIRNSVYWYDTVSALAIVGGDFALASSPATTKTLLVKAIHTDGSVSTPPVADLTFASSDGAKASVGAHTGLVTGIATGPTTIHVYVTLKDTLDAYAICTVS